MHWNAVKSRQLLFSQTLYAFLSFVRTGFYSVPSVFPPLFLLRAAQSLTRAACAWTTRDNLLLVSSHVGRCVC